MRNFEFHRLDVFTNKKFSGNQLAVFHNATGISDEEMQSIAKEMNMDEKEYPSRKIQSYISNAKSKLYTPVSYLRVFAKNYIL